MPLTPYLSIQFKASYNCLRDKVSDDLIRNFGGGIYDTSGNICNGRLSYYFNTIPGGTLADFGDKATIFEKLIECGVKPWEIKDIKLQYAGRV